MVGFFAESNNRQVLKLLIWISGQVKKIDSKKTSLTKNRFTLRWLKTLTHNFLVETLFADDFDR